MSPIRVLLIASRCVDERLESNAFLDGDEWSRERVDALDAALYRLARGGVELVIVENAWIGPYAADVVAALQSCAPFTPILLVADTGDAEAVLAGLRAGARGCLFADQLDGLATARAIRDITALRAMHAALRASKAKAGAMLRTAPIGIFEADAEFRVTTANAAFARLVDWTEPRAVMESGSSPIGEDDRARLHAILDATGRLEAEPVRLHALNGEEIEVWLSGELLSDECGDGVLLCAVQERTTVAGFDARTGQALKMEALGRLAAGITHEINTPVQFVSDSVQFLHEALHAFAPLFAQYRALRDDVLAGTATCAAAADLHRADEEADLGFILENTPRAVARSLEGLAHVTEIVQSIRDFAHPDTQEKEPADLNQTVRTTLRIARNELRYVADVETEFGELPPVVCRAGEIGQVVLNLLVNAAHAVGEVVGDSGERGRITVRTWEEDGSAIIAVSDTGCGIPESMRERVFEPFFTTKPHGRGTGQGLTLARTVIVDRHDGDLEFVSERGRGTTFYVRLPLEPATVTPVSHAAARLALAS